MEAGKGRPASPRSTCAGFEAVARHAERVTDQLSSLRHGFGIYMQSSGPLIPGVDGPSESGSGATEPPAGYSGSFPDLGDCQERAAEAFKEVEKRSLLPALKKRVFWRKFSAGINAKAQEHAETGPGPAGR